jgi:hypothetical protein
MQNFDEKYLVSEYDYYRAMNSDLWNLRESANYMFEQCFELLHEMQQQLRCHEVPGILRLEAIVVAEEPCPRVRGMMTPFCHRGTLARVLR